MFSTRIDSPGDPSGSISVKFKENAKNPNTPFPPESVFSNKDYEETILSVQADPTVRNIPSPNMAEVWDSIDRFPITQERLVNAKADVVGQLKSLFKAAYFKNRGSHDDTIVRSMDHVVLESGQLGALLLQCYDLRSKYFFHFKHPLFQMMYEFGRLLEKRGYESRRMFHIQDESFEGIITKHSEYYSDFLQKPRRTLANDEQVPIESFDENSQVFLPVCYGFKDYLTGATLENVINNYLDIFSNTKGCVLGAKNITVLLGLYNGVETPIEKVRIVAEQKLQEWKELNAEYLKNKGVNLLHFSDLSKTNYFQASMILLNRWLIERKEIILEKKWIFYDISRYLRNLPNTNPNFVYEEIINAVSKKSKKKVKAIDFPVKNDNSNRIPSASIPIPDRAPVSGGIKDEDTSFHTPPPKTAVIIDTSPSRAETRESSPSTSPESPGRGREFEDRLFRNLVKEVKEVSLDPTISDDNKEYVYRGLASFAQKLFKPTGRASSTAYLTTSGTQTVVILPVRKSISADGLDTQTIVRSISPMNTTKS